MLDVRRNVDAVVMVRDARVGEEELDAGVEVVEQPKVPHVAGESARRAQERSESSPPRTSGSPRTESTSRRRCTPRYPDVHSQPRRLVRAGDVQTAVRQMKSGCWVMTSLT